jgi:hypothetical protein
MPLERQHEVRYVNFRPIDWPNLHCSTRNCALPAVWELRPDDNLMFVMYHCHQHLLEYAQYVFQMYRIVLQASE